MWEKESGECCHMFVAHFVCQYTKELDPGDIFLKAVTFLLSKILLIFPKGYFQVGYLPTVFAIYLLLFFLNGCNCVCSITSDGGNYIQENSGSYYGWVFDMLWCGCPLWCSTSMWWSIFSHFPFSGNFFYQNLFLLIT